jgi:ComF family protein
VRSAFHFDGVVRQAIHELKYYHLKAISGHMAQFLYNFLMENPVPGDAIIPVPIHKNRIKQRGYNQSTLIARELGKLLNLPVIEDCLKRVKDSLPQARSRSLDQRKNNVTEAFICRGGSDKLKKVILVDDVCTSGATLEACAAALKNTEFDSVWGVTIAREV